MTAEKWVKDLVVGWIKPQFFGYNNTACRVEIRVEVEKKTGEFKDVYGHVVNEIECLSITGEIYHGKKLIEVGQIIDTLEEAYEKDMFERFEIPKETFLRLLGVWEGWHLNDCRPYCIHQKPFIKLLEIHCPELLKAENLEKLWQVPELNRCPKCGYKYGTEWRYEPLPEYVKDFLMSLA